jgi:hypothetical protein
MRGGKRRPEDVEYGTGMRSRSLWLLVPAGLLAALLVKVAWPGPASRWFVPLTALWDRLTPTSGPLLAVALVPLALVLVLLVLNLESYPPRDSTGDLQRLLELKERIVHRPRPRRIRESATRTSRRTPAAGGETGVIPAATPGQVLDQLLQLKRQGAWTPHVPDRPDDGATSPE